MHHVEIRESIAASFYQASPAAWQVANDIANARAPYQSVALAVNLTKFKLAGQGSIQVVVSLEVGDAVGIPPNEFQLKLCARARDATFPRFDGKLAVLEESGTRSSIVLSGNYTVPLGLVGEALDETVLKGVAQESLAAFVHWFVTETQTRIAHGTYRTAAELMRNADG